MNKRILVPLALLLMPALVVATEVESAPIETAQVEAVASETIASETVATESPVVDSVVVESKGIKVAAVETVAPVTESTASQSSSDLSKVEDQVEGLNSDLAPVYKMPVWVERVESFCPWKSKDGEGYVRVVRTERHGRHQLFLQWIQKGGTTATDKVLSTRSVEELENDYIVRLEMPKAMLNPKSCELTTMADSLNNSQRFRFKVVLREPGNYMLQVTQVLGTAEI